MSIQPCDELLAKYLTMLGTKKFNKPEFKVNKTCPAGSTLFGHTKDKKIYSYVPKKNKVIVLLSMMHHDQYISTENYKPEMIND